MRRFFLGSSLCRCFALSYRWYISVDPVGVVIPVSVTTHEKNTNEINRGNYERSHELQ